MDPVSSGLLVLDSADIRALGDSIASATYPVGLNAVGAFACSLVSYSVLSNEKTINASNDTAFYDTGTQTFPVVLAHGWYTPVQLAVEASAKMTASGGAGAAAFAYAAAPAAQFSLATGVAVRFIKDPRGGPSWSWVNMMGFRDDAQLRALARVGGVVDLSPLGPCLYITSGALHAKATRHDNSSMGTLARVLGVVYLYKDNPDADAPGPVRATHVIERPKMIRLDPGNPINIVDIQVLDARGRPIPAPAGTDGASLAYQLVVELVQTLE